MLRQEPQRISKPSEHLSEREIESYCLHRMNENALCEAETHILLCSICQVSVASEEALIERVRHSEIFTKCSPQSSSYLHLVR